MKQTIEPSRRFVMRHSTAFYINEHLEHARLKHAWRNELGLGISDAFKFSIVERELLEMAAAMLKGDRRGVKNEALDAIAALVRIVEGD